jgi:ribosome-associated protein
VRFAASSQELVAQAASQGLENSFYIVLSASRIGPFMKESWARSVKMSVVKVTDNGDLLIGTLSIPASEIDVKASTSGGPGGQHANRTLSRITVAFTPAKSDALSDHQRDRLAATLPAVLRVSVATHRSQSKNRVDALLKLGTRIEIGLRVPTRRRPTKATKGSSLRRLESKRIAGRHKAQRGRPRDDD